MVDYPDILNYTRDELVEEFCKLFDRFQELRESNEADTQKIHELKRSLDTATAAQAYLSLELEQYTSSDNTKDGDELLKITNELMELKKKYGKLEESFGGLQQDYNLLLEENSKLSQSLAEATKRKDADAVAVENRLSEDDLQRIQMLEIENMDLLEQLKEFEESAIRSTLTIAEYEKNLEILRDQINCLEENLQFKKDELEEKVQILESTQEQLAEANAKIAMLSTAPEAEDRKGNSLFAEVDDQRQAMKQLLAAQKKHYMQMKKIYNESEHEIRRLKRENISMHTELEACGSIFCNADKVYQEKLNERVRHLLNQNEDLERKLNWTQERLKELAKEKGVSWFDSMLSFCKKETDELKTHLHSVRLQQASLEEQLRNSQQDMARWRFESLKSRCILLDREQLLTENNIAFKPMQAMEFRITEKEKNEARPRIVSSRRSSALENIERRSMTPLKAVNDENANAIKEEELSNKKFTEPQPVDGENVQLSTTINADNKSISESPKGDGELNIDVQFNANTANQSDTKETSEVCEKKCAKSLPFTTYIDEPMEDKENCVESDMPLKSKFSKLIVNHPSPMRKSQRSETIALSADSQALSARSILTKERDLFSKESNKIVRFSPKEDIIHHLSPGTPSSSTKNSSSSLTAMACNKDAGTTTTAPQLTAAATPPAKINNNNPAVVKQSRTKSNIVVRRIIVGSKHN